MLKIMEIEGIPLKLITSGYIKVGEKGKLTTSAKGNEFRLPQKLKYFKVTTTERGEDENLIEDTRLTDELISSGQCMVDSDGKLNGIPVRLLYDDINLNFPHRMASYSGGNLVCQGNGKKAWGRIDDFQAEKECPCYKFGKDYTKNDKCKYAGTLTIMLDAATLYGQVHKFTTTGKNSVEGLAAGIRLIMLATKGRIAGLPLMLTMNNLSTITPDGVPTTIPVVGLCYRGNQIQMRDECIGLIENDQKFAIDMKQIEENAYATGGGVVVENDKEHQEEFHPESAQCIEAEFSETQPSAETEKEVPVDEQKSDVQTKQPEGSSGTSRDLLSEEDRIKYDKRVADQAKETEQITLTLRLKKMLDPTKAIALMKRLKTEFLVAYLQAFCPASVPVEKLQKPGYIKIAEDFIGSPLWEERTKNFVVPNGQETSEKSDGESTGTEKDADTSVHPFIAILSGLDQPGICKAIREAFPDYVLNGTLQPSLLIKEAEKLIAKRDADPAHDEETKPVPKELEKAIDEAKQNYEASDDDSGEFPGTVLENFNDPRYSAGKDDPISIQTDWILCVQKKKAKKMTDAQWGVFVSRFKDSSGATAKTTTLLTVKQVEFLLELVDLEPPF